MPTTERSGTRIHYETHGDPDDVPLQLINGLGTQLIGWDPELIDAFTGRGFFVLTHDNRDVGRSEWFDDADHDTAAYTLSDMAGDAVAVLDEVGVETAHLFGMSMGGMIGQTMAIEYRPRLASLTSVMSTTSDLDLPGPTAEAHATLTTPPPADRDGAVAQMVENRRVIGSPEHFEEDLVRERAVAAYDRAFHPAGTGRQMLAIGRGGPRSEALRAVDMPTLVVHGDADPLIPLAGGERTAAVIAGAELLVLEGMGHDLPRVFQPQIVEAVTRLAASVEVSA